MPAGPALLPLLGCCALLGRPAGPAVAARPRGGGAGRAALRGGGDGYNDQLETQLFMSPAEALISSPALRQGASVLLHIIRDKDGSEHLTTVVDKALAQLESGEEDLNAMLPEGLPWEATGMSRAEAVDALRGSVRLLDIGSPCEDELEVTSRSCFTFHGVYRGDRVELGLERRDARAAWGVYSPFAVVSGPPGLLGKRVVEVNSDDTSDSPANNPFSGVSAGDRLYFADPDRAAVKEIALHDHLPEMSRWLAPLLDVIEQVDRGEAEGLVVMVDDKIMSLEDIFLEDDLQDAIRSYVLTKYMDSEDDRVRARMHRLSEFPAVRELQKLVAADTDWQELAEALRPRSKALYAAARIASLKARSLTAEDEDRVIVYKAGAEDVGIAVAFIALLVASVVAFSSLKLAGSESSPSTQESLPLYSLQKEATPRTVPLLYGTPLMPAR